ncbi:MAG: hypothetical protein OXB88_07535 [Bacteriovoracales bacterium]|nr:hypothetical protein [Bacteriovoracales bacterium]
MMEKNKKVTTRTSSKNCNKGKVTVLHPDKIGRRQRGATEACFLHVARKRQGSRLPRLPGGEQLHKKRDSTIIRSSHSLLLFLTLTFSFNVWANSIKTADALFLARGDDPKNALQAAKIYGNLAAEKINPLDKGTLLFKQCFALHYVVTMKEDKELSKRASLAAKTASDLFPDPETFEEEELKAKALLCYGVHSALMGSTVNAIPVYKSAEAMKKIIEMGHGEIYDYGPYQVLGRIKFMAPQSLLLGDKKEAEYILAKAFEKTLISKELPISKNGLNNLFYAQALDAVGKKERACEILKLFVEQDPKTLHEDRIPETKHEMKEARTWLRESNCW